jgi:tetratricopeptide (TPR) repeat protein
VLKIQPRRVDAIVGLGVALRGLASAVPGPQRDEYYTKAAAQYRRALSVDPNHTDAIYNLGHLYMDYVNNKDKAEKWYKEYLSKATRYTSAAARKSAREQLSEIAYQRKVEAKMKKMEQDSKRRREEQPPPMTTPPPPAMDRPMDRPRTAPKGMDAMPPRDM